MTIVLKQPVPKGVFMTWPLFLEKGMPGDWCPIILEVTPGKQLPKQYWKENPRLITYRISRLPYIIFHGENDRRTGVVQSEMLYRSLKALNRSVEYVRHPGATHEITRSGNNRQRIDQLLRTYEFFERFIK